MTSRSSQPPASRTVALSNDQADCVADLMEAAVEGDDQVEMIRIDAVPRNAGDAVPSPAPVFDRSSRFLRQILAQTVASPHCLYRSSTR